MKIATITCHKVYNHGATLQEYALLKHLESLGHDGYTVNYQPYYFTSPHTYFQVESPKFRKNILIRAAYMLAKFPKKFASRKRRSLFDAFEHQFIKTTSNIYRNNDDLSKNPPSADCYICGSDQIWNPLFPNGSDKSFYLDWAPAGKKRISYAASFATETIPEKLSPFVKEMVSGLDHVSVREKSGKDLLHNLGVNHVTQVLDPVFLLSKEEWETQFIRKNTNAKPYLLIYDFDSNPLLKRYAETLKKEKGYQIIALNKNIQYADTIFWNIAPNDFLNLIYYAEFVLSNSFHSTAFSIIFQKQFLTFNRSTGINTRMRDLLNQLAIGDRLIGDYEEENLRKTIDFQNLFEKLESTIKISKDFLTQALNNERMDK